MNPSQPTQPTQPGEPTGLEPVWDRAVHGDLTSEPDTGPMSQFKKFISRHVAASIVAGVALIALAGGGIAYAATRGGSSTTSTATAATAPATTVPSGKAKKSKADKTPATEGTINAMNGGSWTLKTKKDASVTVMTSQTAFGTAKAPSSASNFTVGAPVRVVGTVSGSTVNATRILSPKSASPRTSTTVAP